jgi:hypothetical protein
VVFNEQILTTKMGNSSHLYSTQDSKPYLLLQEQTLEYKALSIPPPLVLFACTISERYTVYQSEDKLPCFSWTNYIRGRRADVFLKFKLLGIKATNLSIIYVKTLSRLDVRFGGSISVNIEIISY